MIALGSLGGKFRLIGGGAGSDRSATDSTFGMLTPLRGESMAPGEAAPGEAELRESRRTGCSRMQWRDWVK